jgi:hypothetical protein
MRKLALVAMLASAILAAFVPWACAQRAASGAMGHFVAPARPSTPAVNAPAFNRARGSLAVGHNRPPFSRFPHNVPFGSQLFPLLSDWFNPQDLSAQDLYAAGYPVASPLPYFVMQGGPAAAADSAGRQPQPSQESLLIELQGDRYVRVSESQVASGGQPLTLTPDHDARPASAPRQRSTRAISHDSERSQPSVIATATSAAPLPPVVLVLRDGTRQEVHDYTIADGVLYARGDFYIDGYWNKKIELAKLNVPETLTANSTRGVRFVLPSAPNEVITRP